MSKSNSRTTFAWRSLYFTLFTISFLGLLAGTASAQLSTASINGAVRDPSGAVVPNATVVLRSVDTSVDRTSTSNGSGEYAFLNITPGSYTLEASAPGFGLKRVAAFILTVGQTATFDFALALGTESQVVTVEAAGAQLDLTSANLGTVISTKQTNELPLNGRNFTQLLALTPGVAPIMTGQSDGMSSNGGFAAPVAIGSAYSFPAINGQTNRSNFFLIDGLNDYGTLESTYAVPPIIDAIQEFKVVSHTDNAEFGSVLGGVVNVTTKTGNQHAARLGMGVPAEQCLRRSLLLPAYDARPNRRITRISLAPRSEDRSSFQSCMTEDRRPSFLALIRVSGIHSRKTTTCWFRLQRSWQATKAALPPSTIRSPHVLTRASPEAIFAIPFPAIRSRRV